MTFLPERMNGASKPNGSVDKVDCWKHSASSCKSVFQMHTKIIMSWILLNSKWSFLGEGGQSANQIFVCTSLSLQVSFVSWNCAATCILHIFLTVFNLVLQVLTGGLRMTF